MEGSDHACFQNERKGLLLTVATTTPPEADLLVVGQGTIQTVHGDNPVTGNGKQIQAGIADGNTG